MSARVSTYSAVQDTLKHILFDGKYKSRTAPSQQELDEQLFAEKPGLEAYRPLGPDGPVVTALSAISLINRYFCSLKLDKFSKPCPIWWLEERDAKFKCSLMLPMDSKVRGLVEGTWQSTKEDAKRSVALEATKKLHCNNELNDSLLPTGCEMNPVEQSAFCPNYFDPQNTVEDKDGNIIRLGTKKHKRPCHKRWPTCLIGCRPLPNSQAYLHVIQVRPVYTVPAANHRLRTIHHLLNLTNDFAILSSKKLPKLAQFPLYLSTGELEATIQVNHPITLDVDQLERITDFHSTMFDDVLSVAKKFMIRDFSNTQNAYLIVPVKTGPDHSVTIDWNVMDETTRPFPSIYTPPTPEERSVLQITDDNYNEKIVAPWYRTVPAQKYIVTKVCHDMSEKSKFPNDSYNDYKEYFQDKYSVETLVDNQPLLEVRALSSRIKSTKPRAQSKQEKRRQNKDDNEDFEVWLLPEFCVVYPLQGRYWLKAQLVPSALHRISQLCTAEELLVTIAQETNVRAAPPGAVLNKLEQDISLLVKKDDCELEQALKPLTTLTLNTMLKSSVREVGENLWEDQEPVDIEREMTQITLIDIENYSAFIKKPLMDKFQGEKRDISVLTGPDRHRLQPQPQVAAPVLEMLRHNTADCGPQQVELLQALTVAAANDFVSCERLETLGDSFLKFAVSVVLFEALPDSQEGNLTSLKGQVVGNKNLYCCGIKKDIGSLLEVQDFSPKEDWVAPGFCIDSAAKSVLLEAGLNPNCLYNVVIPEEDRISGSISPETQNMLSEVLFNADDIPLQTQNCALINQLALTDKNISDAVEAILGSYLKSCGILGALEVMNWFGVTNAEKAIPAVLTQTLSSPRKGKGDPNDHLENPDLIEGLLHYQFRDRGYLLQALSHSSYSRNNVTTSFQRLEFLGDAVLDFLVTVHIFEKCTNLSPGELTDLRSALVNNITLACICVRNKFHTFLLHRSTKLVESMLRFIKHQEDKDHKIDNDILFLIEERETKISEAVDVPKTLGDIVEALIGAIYLDSGKDLNVTWKIVYNLIRHEIETFVKDVPKNHVRMLYEAGVDPQFSHFKIDKDGILMVTVDINFKGQQIRFDGFGDNKRQAKRAAAKHALRHMRNSDAKQ